METKYYQLRERVEEANSIGVIKSENGEFDLEQIKIALQSHFDEGVSFIKVEEYGVYEEIVISFRLDVREEIEIVDGEQTWLYF